MNSVENKSVKIPKNIEKRMLTHMEINSKRAKLKGLFSDKINSLVAISSPDGIA